MRKSIMTFATVAVVALMYGSGIAKAGPMPGIPGTIDFANADGDALIQRVRGGHGGHGGHGGRGGSHGFGHRGGGHAFAHRGGGHGFIRRHRHHGNFFAYGSPYYSDCWYSRRYHRWVCPYY